MNKEQLLITAPEQVDFGYLAALYFLDAGHYLFKTPFGSKFVTHKDVTAAFSEREEDSGWLPAGIVRCGHNADGPWFAYSAPPQKVEIDILDTGQFTAPIPRTVLVGVGGKFYLWALRSKHFNAKEMAYTAPFPNVHEDGHICWGSNAVPKVSPDRARAVWELFFSSAFNNHLSNGKSRAYPNNVVEQIRRLAEKKANIYPADDLIELREPIGRIIERLVERRR